MIKMRMNMSIKVCYKYKSLYKKHETSTLLNTHKGFGPYVLVFLPFGGFCISMMIKRYSYWDADDIEAFEASLSAYKDFVPRTLAHFVL